MSRPSLTTVFGRTSSSTPLSWKANAPIAVKFFGSTICSRAVVVWNASAGNSLAAFASPATMVASERSIAVSIPYCPHIPCKYIISLSLMGPTTLISSMTFFFSAGILVSSVPASVRVMVYWRIDSYSDSSMIEHWSRVNTFQPGAAA